MTTPAKPLDARDKSEAPVPPGGVSVGPGLDTGLARARVRVALTGPVIGDSSIELPLVPRVDDILDINDKQFLILRVVIHAGTRSDGIVATLLIDHLIL